GCCIALSYCRVPRYWLHLEYFFFSSRRRHTRLVSDWSSDVCSSDLSLLVMVGNSQIRLAGQWAILGVSTTLLHRILGHVLALTQIGRASCRERGEISGGLVVLRPRA